jgi:hypothetical protein
MQAQDKTYANLLSSLVHVSIETQPLVRGNSGSKGGCPGAYGEIKDEKERRNELQENHSQY